MGEISSQQTRYGVGRMGSIEGVGDRTSDIVVRTLERLGFTVAFGIPGMWSIPLYNSLSSSKIRHILVRHEEFAAYAADGYARASGKAGLCVGTAGPGAVNIAAGLAAPFKDHSPVIAVTGQVPTGELGKGWIEDLDLQSIFRGVTKYTVQLCDPAAAYDAIADCYRRSLEGCPGPCHISIPGDIQRKHSVMKDYIPEIAKVEPEPALVEETADLISSSDRPLIIAGWGAIHSGASPQIIKLAEAIPAPVATSYMGRGVVPEDSHFSLGPAGKRGTDMANAALSSCDLLLALGCRLTNLTVGDSRLRCKIVQVDVEPENFTSLPALRIRGDASLFAEALLRRLRHPKRSGLWASHEREPPLQEGRSAEFMRAIASMRDSVFTVDIGKHTIWALKAIRAKSPRSIIFSGNLSAMGFSLPAALGAKVALPDRKVIAIMGDGGFQMTCPELSTLKENGLAVAVCVFNNGTLGLIRQLQERAYGKPFGVDYSSPPDYIALAKAFGVKGVLAESPPDAADALSNFDEPLVVEIRIPRDEPIPMGRPRVIDD